MVHSWETGPAFLCHRRSFAHPSDLSEGVPGDGGGIMNLRHDVRYSVTDGETCASPTPSCADGPPNDIARANSLGRGRCGGQARVRRGDATRQRKDSPSASLRKWQSNQRRTAMMANVMTASSRIAARCLNRKDPHVIGSRFAGGRRREGPSGSEPYQQGRGVAPSGGLPPALRLGPQGPCGLSGARARGRRPYTAGRAGEPC